MVECKELNGWKKQMSSTTFRVFAASFAKTFTFFLQRKHVFRPPVFGRSQTHVPGCRSARKCKFTNSRVNVATHGPPSYVYYHYVRRPSFQEATINVGRPEGCTLCKSTKAAGNKRVSGNEKNNYNI